MRDKILVVDDISANIAVLSGILKKDYETFYAKSGKSALDLVKQNRPDLILLDIMMPGMDGYEVIRELKSNPDTRYIPVIFITAKDQDVDEIKGFKLGAVDYITKPVNPEIVKTRVAAQLALFSHNKDLEEKVLARTKEINEARLDIVQKLIIASEYKDTETGNHILRMSKYCYLVAKEYGLSEYDANILKEASPMHDIGKLGVADNILLKEGPLTDQEYEAMTKHTIIGAKILGTHTSDLLSVAYTVAYQHHEKWNGTGYPKKLKADQIDINARIAALADVFDALTSDRPYKKAWDINLAVNLINDESSKHFDPKVVNAFNKALPKIIEVHNEYA
jgi:putative two-component system response regulator